MTLLRITLATILQRIQLALAPGTRIDRKYHVTIAPKYGMPMTVRRNGQKLESVRPQGSIHDMVDLG
jgi:hypothetical protein